MSLVGNLEDLSLGDILQIISLSQKSGVLALSSELGAGRIVFANGLVQAACVKGEPNNLRDLLVAKGEVDPAGFDASVARARDLDQPVETILARDAGLGPERIEALVHEAVEAAILEMFTWPSGDFSFDVRTELDGDDPVLCLAQGMNAQYLAMEGLRLRDERDRDGDSDDRDSDGDEDEATQPNVSLAEDPLFGDEPLEVDPEPVESVADVLAASAIDQAEAVLTLEEVEAALPIGDESTEEPLVERLDGSSADATDTAPGIETTRAPETADTSGAEAFAEAVATDATSDGGSAAEAEPARSAEVLAAEAQGAAGASAPISSAEAARMPVVLIDPDVAVLDWVKAAIEGEFARVHVFQQAEQGLARIRQYLIRGQVPLVLVSPEIQIDPLSGIRGLGDFVKRLKAQSPRIVVLGLREDEDAAPAAMPNNLNGVLRRPPRRSLVEQSTPEGAAAGQVLARALLEILAQTAPGANAASVGGAAPASLRALRDATTKLQEASSRGEVLPVVLDFASALFARVAILVVREDTVFAVAGRGIPALEVDPLGADPAISFARPQAGWIHRVLETGAPVVAAPEAEADALLLERFGGDLPKQAYLGPIESGSSVIAVLYGDQSANDAPMPDTHGLEVVLQHAGLALDRAALERALWEVDANA